MTADRLTEIAEGPAVLRDYAYDDADRPTEAADQQGQLLQPLLRRALGCGRGAGWLPGPGDQMSSRSAAEDT